jgi:hypothetical protein
MTATKNIFSLAKWGANVAQGQDYEHSAFKNAASIHGGRVLNIATDGRTGLSGGGKILSIADMIRPPLILEAAGANIDEKAHYYAASGGVAGVDDIRASWIVDGETFLAEKFTTSHCDLGSATAAGAFILSRRLSIQTGPEVELMLRMSMMKAMRAATEKAIIAGTGNNGIPRGIINESAFPLSNGPVTLANLMKDVGAVVDQGGNPELISIIASSKDMEDLAIESGANVLSSQGKSTTGAHHNVKGFGIRFSPYLAKGEAITGQFDQFVVTYFEDPEMIVDRYTLAASGRVRYMGLQMVGAGAFHTHAFARRRPAS